MPQDTDQINSTNSSDFINSSNSSNCSNSSNSKTRSYIKTENTVRNRQKLSEKLQMFTEDKILPQYTDRNLTLQKL